MFKLFFKYLGEHDFAYRKIKDWSNIFPTVMVAQTVQPYIQYESHSALGHNGSKRLYILLKSIIIGRNCTNIAVHM